MEKAEKTEKKAAERPDFPEKDIREGAKGILTWAEVTNGKIARPSLELLTPARKLANELGGDTKISTVLIGKNVKSLAQTLIEHGSDEVILVENDKLEEYLAGNGKEVELVSGGIKKTIKIKEMGSNLPVGDLQKLLDNFVTENPESKIDYVHGEDSVKKLAVGNNVGLMLSGMKKEELFPTVEKDGALPRKTFSMGEAEEKRYYLESRKIVR